MESAATAEARRTVSDVEWSEWRAYYAAQRALDENSSLEAIDYRAGECPHPRTYAVESCLNNTAEVAAAA